MGENSRTTYTISEAARELGISIEWLRAGERRGYFSPALRDRNGHRYYTEEDIERMRQVKLVPSETRAWVRRPTSPP
jgi:DNA-binding transcriptional MerR regulator